MPDPRASSFLLQLVPLAVFAIIPSIALSASIDPASLARAQAGDATAQLAAGEQLIKDAAAEQDRERSIADYQQAATWFSKLAAQGNVAGEIHLADLYRDGRGVPRDMSQAAVWYRKAADQDDPSAQATLGVLYSMGQGVEQNDDEAYFWLDLASSADGPNQQKYATNRNSIGTRITTEELAAAQQRVKHWKTAHAHTETANK